MKCSSNQRKSGRFVCWPRLSADGVGVQGGDGENCRWVEGVFWRTKARRHEGTKSAKKLELTRSFRSKSPKGRSLMSYYGWGAECLVLGRKHPKRAFSVPLDLFGFGGLIKYEIDALGFLPKWVQPCADQPTVIFIVAQSFR